MCYNSRLSYNLASTHITITKQFDTITLFPDFFTTPLSSVLLGKALYQEIAKVNLVNPRDYTTDKHNEKDRNYLKSFI